MRRLSTPLLLMAMLGAGCTRPDAALHHRESRTAPFPEGSVLEVRAINGAIQVEGWDRPELEVEARIRQGGGPATWTLSSSGGSTLVEAHVLPGSGGACGFTLRVPRDLQGAFQTTSGAIHAEGLRGRLRFETGSGALSLQDLAGSAEASTAEGAVVIKHVSGGLDVHVGAGAISASNLDGQGQGIRLRTGHGELRVSLGAATGRIRALAGGEGRVTLKHRGAVIERSASAQAVEASIPGSTQLIALESGDGSVTIR